ncbi:MAG: GNAT family N-acetyltransferase [Caldilinea sp.]|nr:GNAT family N-acetyltransferase [Caldilinea sp.]MDW8441153.1 GNAT family N-acetyltransferase [Caldilineaceae bacterium]
MFDDLIGAEVYMIRPTMDDLPDWPLPEGYRFRTYRDGDLDVWLALHHDAEPFLAIGPEHFARSFGNRLSALYDRMFFVQTLVGEDVGSITAWWEEDWQGRGAWGRIHWVIVARAHQRRGLAKPMMAHALRRIARDHSRAMLGTDTLRLWAIKTYLDCGFIPDPMQRNDAKAVQGWRSVQKHLHHPAIEQWLQGETTLGR